MAGSAADQAALSPPSAAADPPRQTVGTADPPRQTVGTADPPRQTVGTADSPRQTVGTADSPRHDAETAYPSALAAEFAALWQSLGPAAPAPLPPSGGSDGPPPPPAAADTPPPPATADTPPPLLVSVGAGFRAAGDQAVWRALRLASPHTARAPLQEWVDASTCVLLERDEGPAAGQRPSLTLTVADGHHAAIAEVALLSEFGRCELYGDHGEYLATEEAVLEETVDDTQVLSLRHRCRLPVTQLTVQCVSAAGRSQLWLYGIEVLLQPTATPRDVFSLPAVLARLSAQEATLSEGAETLRATLAAAGAGTSGPPTLAALTAAFASSGGGRTPAVKSAVAAASAGSGEQHTVRPPAAQAPVWLQAAVEHAALAMEERLWQKIAPRLEQVERKQDRILEALDRLSRTVSLQQGGARDSSSRAGS